MQPETSQVWLHSALLVRRLPNHSQAREKHEYGTLIVQVLRNELLIKLWSVKRDQDQDQDQESTSEREELFLGPPGFLKKHIKFFAPLHMFSHRKRKSWCV